MIPVNTHTPIISAAMAVPTFRCTAMLLMVTHVFSVNSFDHHSASTLPMLLARAIPKSFDCLPHVSITFRVNNNFPLSFGSHVGPVIGLLLVFPKDVLHIVVNL